MARLKQVDCSGPGYRRRRRGRGFEYLDEAGERINSLDVLARIKAIAIPPAWDDVWICRDANGHLQATGIDSAGRKQYLYHERWRERRDQEKFDEMLAFASSLSRMRRKVTADLRRDEMTREKVLACAARLLDCGFFRVGSESYAEQNGSFGLATMKKAHVHIDGRVIKFDYPAKGGQRRVQSIVDPEVHDIIARLKKRRGGGEQLLAYKQGRRWVDISSSDINDYLKPATGGDFSAKDFRTWNATMLAAVALASDGAAATSKTARERAIKEAVKGVAYFLRNTPAVARSSYIDPRVFDRYRSGWTIGGAVSKTSRALEVGHPAFRGAIERAVIDLLAERRSEALEKVA
jgi:DNA topoisomerase IB